MFMCVVAAMSSTHFIDNDMELKVRYSQETKKSKYRTFLITRFILLGDINNLARLNHVLKVYEKASSSKVNFLDNSGNLIFQFY